jgi:MFS family permease
MPPEKRQNGAYTDLYLGTVLYMGKVLKTLWVLLAAVVCGVVFGVGVPLLWVWVASHLQTTVGQGTTMLAAALVILGPLFSYFALVWFVGHFRFAQRPSSERPRMAWTQSRDEIRQKARYTTTFEQIVLLAILIVGLGFEVWYFGFARCPSGVCFA